MAYHLGAKNVRKNVAAMREKVRDSICDLRNVIASLTGSRKSCVVSVERGEARVSLPKTVAAKTDWQDGARNVHTKLPKNHSNQRGKGHEGIFDTKIVIG